MTFRRLHRAERLKAIDAAGARFVDRYEDLHYRKRSMVLVFVGSIQCISIAAPLVHVAFRCVFVGSVTSEINELVYGCWYQSLEWRVQHLLESVDSIGGRQQQRCLKYPDTRAICQLNEFNSVFFFGGFVISHSFSAQQP